MFPHHRLLFAFVLFCIFTVSANTCLVNLGTHTVDLGIIPVSQFQQPQLYDGTSTNYIWVISLCDPTSQPPGSSVCSGGRGYIQQFETDSIKKCAATFGNPIGGPQWTFDSASKKFIASVSDVGPVRQAQISVGCGGHVSTGNSLVPATEAFTVSKPVANGPFQFDIELLSPVACEATPPTTTSQPVPPPATTIGPSSPTSDPTGSSSDNFFPGFTNGVAFLCVVFGATFFYLVLGILYKRFAPKRYSEDSADDSNAAHCPCRCCDENCPNADFWASVPGLIWEGHKYLWRRCRGKPAGPPTSRSPMYSAEGAYSSIR